MEENYHKEKKNKFKILTAAEVFPVWWKNEEEGREEEEEEEKKKERRERSQQ